MTEEMNNEIKEEKKCQCLCCSEGFKDFLKIAIGTFVGVFLALSLFAALHKPPVPRCPYGPMMVPPMHYGQHFNRMPRGDFHKVKLEKKNFNKQIPVRVEVEQD